MKDLLATIDLYDDDTLGMAQGGRIGFKDGMKEMEDQIIFNYKKKRLKELEAGKKPSEIQSYEDYIKTQKEVDMNPGKKKLDKAIADAKKLIKGNTLSAKIPGVESLLKVADNIKGDIAKKKFLTAGFKTLGIAVGAPLVAFDTYKAFKKGKPVLEALEAGFIGSDMIGGTKRILALTPEEREARSVVKQDALKDLNLDMPMGFGFIEGPTPKTDMTLEQAQAKAAAGEERVKSLETQKNLQRATDRANFFGNIRDKIFGAPQSLSFAGGGVAGLSGGIDEGPQRTSMNPDSQGLSGLLKRVKKG
jgi:hypothetical protein